MTRLFFSKKEPVILKETSDAKRQIFELEAILPTAPESIKPQIEKDIKRLTYGVFGEEQILFELKNSHIPMYVLHDLYLEDEGRTAQIDFLIITEKAKFVLECKNLIGNIEINDNGDFIRLGNYGKGEKEGIYSPITQNRRHIELIKQICGRTKTKFFKEIWFEKNFYSVYQSVVVLTNPKTVLYDKYAKKEVKEQVIRVDHLVEHIRQVNAKFKGKSIRDKRMAKLAAFFLSMHKENQTVYSAKYKSAMSSEIAEEKPVIEKATEPQMETVQKSDVSSTADSTPACPKCNTPMVLRTAAKGEREGKQFWGCVNYPKCRSIINLE